MFPMLTCVIPNVYKIQGEPHSYFFRGRLKRNAGGKIRAKLGAELNGAPDVIIEEGSAGEGGKAASQIGMRKSIFCLNPAGDTPSSARLFDAIISGFIPVVVSDELELPFEGILDYRKIAVFVSSGDAVQPGWLLSYFRSISTTQIREKQINLAKIHEEARKFSNQTGVKVFVLYGGAPAFQQVLKTTYTFSNNIALVPYLLLEILNAMYMTLSYYVRIRIILAGTLILFGITLQIKANGS